MLKLDIREDVLNFSEEIYFNTKIDKSLNGKEYRKNLHEDYILFININLKSQKINDLQKLNNLLENSIDKKILYKKYESYIIEEVDFNINSSTIKVKKDKTIKKNLDYIDNRTNYFFFIEDDYNINKFSIYKYEEYDDYYILFLNGLYSTNNYDVNSSVYIRQICEIQNKTINLNEKFNRFNEINLKLKIIDEIGENINV